MYKGTLDVESPFYSGMMTTEFSLPMEPVALAAQTARQQFSLGSGNIIVADFNMWFGDCWPDGEANPGHTPGEGRPAFIDTFVTESMVEGVKDQYCNQGRRVHFNSMLQSPWVTAGDSGVQSVELCFASDWFVQVEMADTSRSCCGRSEVTGKGVFFVPYAEQGIVQLELELVSGAVLVQELRTWGPIPYADKGKLQAPRNEAVVLRWNNSQGLDVKRVRAGWQVKMGFNQG